jgi:DNA-binding SARP family transcriptional activator
VTRSASVELRLLGRFVVLRNGREVPTAEFGGRKVRALVRILATRRGSVVPSERLVELLWGDQPPADPAANLQVLINRARRALGRPELILTGHGGYGLAAGSGCIVDVEELLAAVAAARDLARGADALDAYRAALARWTGDPLAEDSYADWAEEYRAELIRARQVALEDAAQLALDLGAAAEAVEFAARAAGADPLREVAVLLLVRALAAAGDPAAALGRYEQFRRTLADELGVDPSPAAQEVHRGLLGAGGRTQHARSRPFGEPGFDRLPFVGRSAELAELVRAATVGEVALLLGESGAGKSRLLEQLTAQVPALRVRAFLAEQNEPWSLARTLLREVLTADATGAARLPGPLTAALSWLLPEVESATGSTPPDPESRRALLTEASVRLLAEADTAILVDDLQWADATSLAVLGVVLDRLDGVGAVLAARPVDLPGNEAAARWVEQRRHAAQVIQLGPLSAAEIGELVGDAELAGQLSAVTDRTPIALAEVLRALAADGAIARTTQQRWRVLDRTALARVEPLALEGQRSAIARRVAAQSDASRVVVELLGLLGRESSAQLLALATGTDERDVLDLLAALAQAGLVRLGDRGWAPAHDMVGEVVAHETAPDERAGLHARLARAIERLGGEPGEAAAHWFAAGDGDRAAEAYRDAAARTLDAYADAEAVRLADAGLAVVRNPGIRVDLHAVRATGRARRGDIVGARSDLRTALADRSPGPQRARLLARLATLASGAQDLVRAAELAEAALVEAGNDDAARAAALEIGAVLDMNLYRTERAAERAAEALERYERIGDAAGRARVLDGRAMATFLAGEVGHGTQLLQRAADLFEDSGELLRVITPRSTAGHGLVFAGAAAGGLELSTSALELARTLGNPEGQTYALWHCTEAYAADGRTDEALAAGQEALAIAQRIGHRGWTATAYRALGIARQTVGDLDAALAAFESSLEVSENFNLFASWAAARVALVLLALGRVDDAAPFARRALAEGVPLAHFEARLAQVELAAAEAATDVAELAAAALRRADEAGVRQNRERLVELAGLP